MKANQKTSPTKKTVAAAKSKPVIKKVVKPAAIKKPLAALSQKLAEMPSSQMMETMEAPRKSGLKRPATWLVGAWIVVIGLALFYYRGQFVVAVVNGQPIFRSALVRELERQSGKQVLDNLVLKTVVMQEASKQKVTVTDQEVTDEIAKLEKTFKGRGQDLDSALATQGMSRSDLNEQMKLQKLVEKMVSKEVEVTDEEVTKYMETNKAFLPKDAKPDQLKADIKAQLLQQKQTAKIQEWVTALKDKATVQHWLFQ